MAAAQARRPLKMVAAARAFGGKGNGAGGPASLEDVGGFPTLTSQGVEWGRTAPREPSPTGVLLGGSWAPAAWPCCSFPWEGRGKVTKVQ